MQRFNVAKFGGTSVANFDAMDRCANIINNNPKTKLVLISACSGVTNLLVHLARGISDETERESIIQKISGIHNATIECFSDPSQVRQDVNHITEQIAQYAITAATKPSKQLTDNLVACGELISTFLLTQLMRERGLSAQRFDIRQVLRTDSHFGKAEPQMEQIEVLAQKTLAPLLKDHIVVTQGFIGSDASGNTTTLGRGGSDYSAALIAEAIKADGLEIWTDVPGMYTTDPRIVPQAEAIAEISFSEASEMANFGAKILHPSTLVPALRHNIPVFVGSSKQPEKGGTWIKKHVETCPPFRSLALRGNQTMVTLRSLDMFHAYGFLAKVFEILAKHKVSVDLITTSEVSVSLTLDQTDTSGGAPTLPLLAKEELEALCTVEVENNLSLVALIGNNMRVQKGYAKQVFGTLEDFNLRMICYGASPHNLCFLIEESVANKAIQSLHKELFENV